MSLSMGEDEYIVACSSYRKVVWLQKLIARLFDHKLNVTCIFCDN